MNWLKSIGIAFGIGVLNSVLATFAMGYIASLCVRWYRISSFEGGSGYFVIGLALLGTIVGFVLGIGISIYALRSGTSFPKALAITTGTTAGLVSVIAAVSWLAADLPPRIDGKELVVDVEVRCPAEFELPSDTSDTSNWYVTITQDHGDRSQSLGQIRLKEATQVDGRWILPATVDLHTSDPGKALGVSFADREPQYFRLPIPAIPDHRDMNWSEWLTEPTFGNLEKVPPGKKVAVRYRVQFYIPPPPQPPPPTQEEIAAERLAKDEAALAALTPESPITEWLKLTDPSKPETIRERAAAAIRERPNVVAELSAQIRSSDIEASNLTLRTVALMRPLPELEPVVSEVGKEIVEEIRVVNRTTVEEDPSYVRAGEVWVRFLNWNETARALHGQSDVNFLPIMEEILQLARVREDSHSMCDIVRISSYYTNKWRN